MVRSRLYRKAALAVICAGSLAALGQYAKKAPKTSGPRALGVLQVAQNGKAHLIAVTMMVDGKFYDAAAYKADPVPMALQPETVYEGVKTGVPDGLFTVVGALHDPKGGWFADGTWRTNEQIEAEKTRHKAEQEKLNQKAPEVQQGPPKLKRGIPTNDPAPASSSDKRPAPSPSGKTDSSASAEKTTSTDSSSANTRSSSSTDSDRPVLRRQPLSETAREQTKSGGDAEPLKGPLQLLPAISDAAGPEPRPYNYEMKPEEEQARLKKILAMATDEVKARAEKSSGSEQTNSAKKSAADVQFKDVQMRVFDLSSTNEPVIVLTANATVPRVARDVTYMTAVVAREDIYGDLHKAFAETTDNQHLDVLPRYELIDAVDADGDGRGELLFRMNWDNGSAFAVYRVIGDRLWPLFEGKPGS